MVKLLFSSISTEFLMHLWIIDTTSSNLFHDLSNCQIKKP